MRCWRYFRRLYLLILGLSNTATRCRWLEPHLHHTWNSPEIHIVESLELDAIIRYRYRIGRPLHNRRRISEENNIIWTISKCQLADEIARRYSSAIHRRPWSAFLSGIYRSMPPMAATPVRQQRADETIYELVECWLFIIVRGIVGAAHRCDIVKKFDIRYTYSQKLSGIKHGSHYSYTLRIEI